MYIKFVKGMIHLLLEVKDQPTFKAIQDVSLRVPLQKEGKVEFSTFFMRGYYIKRGLS